MGVLTGAIAIVKSGGKTIARIKSWSLSENITRGEVVGLGTIYASEVPVTKYTAQLSCSAVAISYKDGIIPNAFRRNLSNIRSQVASGTVSVEDNLVLDESGVTIELYEKIADVLDAFGNIKPKVRTFCTLPKCFLTGQSLSVNESSVSGIDQNFIVPEPPIYP